MTVRVERDGPVWTVILDRPEVRNAVNTASVGVLWGAGGTFCAGGDLKEVEASGAALWLSDIDFPDDDSDPAPNGPWGHHGWN